MQIKKTGIARRHSTAGVAALCCALALSACGGDDSDGNATPKSVGTVKVLSNRADLVSGGDALIEVVPDAGVDTTKLKLDVGGADVTSSFALRANGRFMGLVTGLTNGANLLSAKLPDGSLSTLTIVNHANS